jgi:hypothetical protein
MAIFTELTAYCDETGFAKDPSQKFVGMAGFVAPSEAWESLEHKWKFILKEFKVPYFHMKEYASSVGVFKGWKDNEKKRQAIFSSLIKTIKEIQPLPIGCVFSAEDFRGLSERDRALVDDPYYLAFLACVAIPCLFIQNAPPEIKLATVFGEHSVFASKAAGFHQRVRDIYAVGNRLYSPAFRDMREFVPLQAADIMAYELYKEADRQRYRPEAKSRFGMIELSQLRPTTGDRRNTLIIATKENLKFMIEETKKMRGAVLTGGALPPSPMRMRD